MNDSAGAQLQAENEALQFECELLRCEAQRLVTVNRSLEARLTLARAEDDALRSDLRSIQHSRPWRAIQMVRGWFGRKW